MIMGQDDRDAIVRKLLNASFALPETRFSSFILARGGVFTPFAESSDLEPRILFPEDPRPALPVPLLKRAWRERSQVVEISPGGASRVCQPLAYRGSLSALLFVEAGPEHRGFGRDSLAVLELFASQAACALELVQRRDRRCLCQDHARAGNSGSHWLASHDVSDHDATAPGIEMRFAALSARERQVMQLVASGLMNKQIALELDISVPTVKFHRGAVMKKMAAGSLATLVRMAAALEPSAS